MDSVDAVVSRPEGTPPGRLIQVLSVFDERNQSDVPVVLEIWTSHAELEVLSYATDEEQEAIRAWHTARMAARPRVGLMRALLNRAPPRNVPFPPQPEMLREREQAAWGLSDDLGTQYVRSLAGRSSLDQDTWRFRYKFLPSVPSTATELTLTDPTGTATSFNLTGSSH